MDAGLHDSIKAIKSLNFFGDESVAGKSVSVDYFKEQQSKFTRKAVKVLKKRIANMEAALQVNASYSMSRFCNNCEIDAQWIM